MLPLARSLARATRTRASRSTTSSRSRAWALKAIDRFDLDRDVRFATYAVPTIAGELKRHFRDRGWMMRVPRDVQELTRPDRRARRAARRPRALADRRRARAPPLDSERVLEALAARRRLPHALARPAAQGRHRAAGALGDDDAASSARRQRRLLADGLHELAPREREIVRLRFYEGLTQREIAERIGISQMHVSRLIRRTLERCATGS